MFLKFHFGIGLWVSLTNVFANRTPGGQAVVIDTDIMTDVDDVGALAVANVLHNCGLADLRGIVINTHSKYGAQAANVRADHLNRDTCDAAE